MKKYLFLLVFITTFLASCRKTDGDHINKFTCKVNGVFWEAVPYQRDILGNDLQMSISPTQYGSISADNIKTNQTITFNLSLKDVSKDFVITDNIPYGDYRRKCVGYFLDTLSPRIVRITAYDGEKRLVKGTFAFRAIDIVDSCKDTVTITDGFFDMQY